MVFEIWSSEINYPEVNTFADLPTASESTGLVYIVKTATGVWGINRKRAGLYRSNGSSWGYLGVAATLDDLGGASQSDFDTHEGSATIHHSNVNDHTEAHSHAHSDTTGQGANDHHASSHNVASHSDTSTTGAELNELAAGNDTALHSHAGGGAAVTTPGTVIVNAQASPTSWTDLDTGLGKVAFVTLSIEATSDMDAVAIRRKDDTKEYFNTSVEANAFGNQLGHHDSTCTLVLSCFTKSDGLIQWNTESSATATVTIIGVVG